jgi:F0F1-type ATP synthase assembly protein I
VAAPRNKRTDIWGQVGYYSSLGLVLPAATLAGYTVGWALDHAFNTRPVLSVIMTILGIVGGFVELIRLIGREQK